MRSRHAGSERRWEFLEFCADSPLWGEISAMGIRMDKRARAALFRDRLTQAMTRERINRSALARATGTDRSTIGQLLQPDTARLPGGQLLGDMAAALRVSADWLLGLTDRPERPGDLLAAALSVTGAARSSADAQIMAWHREAAGYKIRHVPATLPDMLKTDPVLRWEYADFLGRTPEQAVRSALDLERWLHEATSDFEFAMPLHELRGFAAGAGYWTGLEVGHRIEQLERLAETCETLYPALRVFLFDARQVFSVPLTVFGPRLAVIYVGRFYLAFRERERVVSLTEHFDWLVREAVVDAREVPAMLRALACEISG